jgi:hypothetical protein
VRAFEAIGGVPELVVPDNAKTAVVRVSFYDPQVNRTYAEMAAHYGTAILPARPRKPRDKAMASYCTSFGCWRGDGRQASGSSATSPATLEDGLACRYFP